MLACGMLSSELGKGTRLKKYYKRRKMCDRAQTTIAFLAKNDRPFGRKRSPFFSTIS
jgi:hypothetical protein